MSTVPYSPLYIHKQIVKAKLFMDHNFRERISLNDIAAQACFSKFHFHRLFKDHYKQTAHQYLTSLRMKEAKRLLKQEQSTIETCYAVGFESPSSFIKLFKRAERLRPSDFSQRAQKLQEKVKNDPLGHIPISYASYLGWDTE